MAALALGQGPFTTITVKQWYALQEVVRAAAAAEDWVSAVAQDYVPNDVFQRSGFEKMEKLRQALAAVKGLT